MKRNVIIAAVAGVVVLAGIVALVVGKKDDSKSNTADATTNQTASQYKQLDACKLFTEADAKSVLGDKATAGSNSAPTNSDDVHLSTCSYTNNGSTVSEIRIITVTARSPITKTGADSNKEFFTGKQRPANAQKVDGLGDDAYWDPSTNQLAISKDSSWIAITYGGTNPRASTLSDAKLVADKVVRK